MGVYKFYDSDILIDLDKETSIGKKRKGHETEDKTENEKDKEKNI
jgi:hypothetical protein